MKLLDSLTIKDSSDAHVIELCHGDLTEMPPDEAVDVLVVSAFPDDYTPTPRSLIGSLYKKGISLADLAKDKEVDLRQNYSCWLSKEIRRDAPGIQFNRILCFEPATRGTPPEVVTDIFQSLMCFLDTDIPISKVAMPLIASGDQNVPLVDMLDPLFDAAVHWMELGLPIQCLKIVQHSELKAAEMKGVFSILKKKHQMNGKGKRYDVFISYCHVNKEAADFLAKELRTRRPDLRIFLDRNVLNPGIAWQQTIYDAIDDCRIVVAVYSPQFLASKMCREEYNIARLRDRDSNRDILLPLYLHTGNLPPHMRVVQYIDCREGDKNKLRGACQKILAHLST